MHKLHKVLLNHKMNLQSQCETSIRLLSCIYLCKHQTCGHLVPWTEEKWVQPKQQTRLPRVVQRNLFQLHQRQQQNTTSVVGWIVNLTSWTPSWITPFCPTSGMSTRVFKNFLRDTYKNQESRVPKIRWHMIAHRTRAAPGLFSRWRLWRVCLLWMTTAEMRKRWKY